MQTLKSAFLYFLPVLAAGFVLGTIRVLWLAPKTGLFAATVIELPVMLAISWLVAGQVINRLHIGPELQSRLAMGIIAFLLLMAAEHALGLAFGKSSAQQLADIQTPAGLAGLAGQIGFGLLPLLVRKS
jgi:ABC-type uncharacterized transport system permease subunit